MSLKSRLLATGLFLIGASMAASADDTMDVCGMSIEGVNTFMSKDEVSAKLTDAGYRLSLDSADTSHRPHKPYAYEALRFETMDRQPNDSFVIRIEWSGQSSDKGNRVSAQYALPNDPDRRPAYDDFLRSTITDYCANMEPKHRAAAPPPRQRPRSESRRGRSGRRGTPGFCERALQGEFDSTSNGYILLPGPGLRYDDEQGCAVSYQSAGAKGFSSVLAVVIEGPSE